MFVVYLVRWLIGWLTHNQNHLAMMMSANNNISIASVKAIGWLGLVLAMGNEGSIAAEGGDVDEKSVPALELAEKWRGQLMEEYPLLAPEAVPVMDENNAYLLIASFENEKVEESPLDGLSAAELLFIDAEGWNQNQEFVREYIRVNERFVEWMEAIAALNKSSLLSLKELPDRSVNGALILQSSVLLLLKARFAAEASDEESALRHVEVVQKVGAHLLGIEVPTLVHTMLVIRNGRVVQRVATEYLLPTLGQQANLDRWKPVLASFEYTPEQFAKTLRGEWYHSVGFWIAGMKADPQAEDQYQWGLVTSARIQHTLIKRLKEVGLNGMINPELWAVDIGKEEASRELMDAVLSGFELNILVPVSYVGAAVIQNQYEAVMDLLIMEAAGENLTEASVVKAAREPVTGQPFVFDPVERTLGWPELPEAMGPFVEKNAEHKVVRLPW